MLVGLPFPRAGQLQLTPNGFTGPVDVGITAVVLDHCCTIEQHHVVILARVKNQGVNERMMESLRNVDPSIGPYARYMHLLEPHASLPPKSGKQKVINLLDRVHLSGSGFDAFEWLRQKRTARITVVARGQLRQKLAVHFGRAEEGDLELLSADGLDSFGRPTPPVTRGPNQ